MLLKKRLVLISSLALVLGFSTATQMRAQEQYPDIVKGKNLYAKKDIRGQEAPALKVKEWLTGAAPNTDNKVVLIDFWATWCGPCRKLIPELNYFQQKYSKNLVVIGISDEDAGTVRNFMQQSKMDYSVAVDPAKKMKSNLGISGIPHVLIITPDHIVRWQGYPASAEDPLTEEKLAQIIHTSSGH